MYFILNELIELIESITQIIHEFCKQNIKFIENFT
jgi:hypothetical protein